MPIHIVAMAAAALGYATAQDCEDPEATVSADNDDVENSSQINPQEQLSPNGSVTSRGTENIPFSEKSVRFSERTIGSEGVRSMYSKRLSTNQHRHMEVRLRSVNSIQSEEDAPFDSLSGFVGGDFSAGKVKDIKLPSGCWVMAFSERADILAAGMKNRVDFLETQNYSTIYSLSFSDKISAIQWCRGSDLCATTGKKLDDGSDREIVAVAGLDGHVAVYRLNVSLLELQGVHLLYDFHVHSQVRCMAMKPLGDGNVVLAVGDKRGRITLTTLMHAADGQVTSTYPAVVDLQKDAVLGLDIHPERSILAASTKSGKVIVFQLIMTKFRIEKSYVICGSRLWKTQQNGPVRAVVISKDGKQLAFGGYDKTLVLVDTNLYAIVRELTLHGTINTITLDPLFRFLVVGCRDKSLTFYDTTTFNPVKRFQTPGWVTSISWGVPGLWSDLVAVRSENKGISLLDLTPITMTDIELPSLEGFGSSLSWSPDGHFLARLIGDKIHVNDSRQAFGLSAHIDLPGSSLRCIAFCPKLETSNEGDNATDARLAAVGLDGSLYMLKFTPPYGLEVVESMFVEENLWVVSWSHDGTLLATGGKGKELNLFSTDKLKLKQSAKLEGRIWDIGFLKHDSGNGQDDVNEVCAMAVASGDYKTIFFETDSLEPTLQVIRSRTVRCLDYHPSLPLLAVGDGASMVAIVDYREEETITEFETGGRVNVLKFSPAGDYLLVGTDDCMFSLHETVKFSIVQEFERSSFALAASFSPTGKYLALGSSNEDYSVLRLGALLGIDFVPLDTAATRFPGWALDETLFRSGFGPSLVQRHMISGSQESLQWVASTLKEHPDSIYTCNRSRKEGCFDTALRLRKIKLLQVAVTTLVDGSLEARNEGRRSILTTDIPEIGRKTLEAMLAKHPPEVIVEILKQMTFVKVPFTSPHVVSREKKLVCASPTYLDPWKHHRLVDPFEGAEDQLTRTAAVLPVPGLGTMSFLSSLVLRAPATAFDNEAMALVLQVMWQKHVRKYFVLDTILFLVYFVLWILLTDSTSSTTVASTDLGISDRAIAITLLLLNSLFAAKEVIQSDFGRRPGYFKSQWNYVDVVSILLVYGYTVATAIRGGKGAGLVPLAVITTLLLTMKLISYLRAFHETGWLVTVLSQNFQDVRGFLVVLFSIIVGFSTSFRLLFANIEPSCSLEIDAETDSIVQECDENPFGSLRRSILSTFEMTILGSYEPSLLYESQFSTLSILTFVLAVTCVLVVALNALISLLADSYARVQENATANRRREKAELIVEYLSLLPAWRRRQIERNTKYFHALLEADADGDLVIEDEDWHGGLNALREDLEEASKSNAEAHQKGLENLRSDFEKELSTFRKDILSVLQDLSDDVKAIQRAQADGGVTFSGKRVAGAVKAVKEIRRRGTELWSPQDKSSTS